MVRPIVLIAVLGVLAEAASASSLTPLGFLAGDTSSYAFGVNGDGSIVVGNSQNGSGNSQAFRWTASTGMAGIGYLPGGSISYANGISADGSVIVGGSQPLSGNGQAFRWTAAGGMVGLGLLPGDNASIATGVSADGSVVVGWDSTAAGSYEAFRWKAGTGMQRLWDVLLAQGVNPAAEGWTALGFGKAVSADGNTIVGYGARNGHTEAFAAAVPEPAALAVIALAALALCQRRQAFTAALRT